MTWLYSYLEIFRATRHAGAPRQGAGFTAELRSTRASHIRVIAGERQGPWWQEGFDGTAPPIETLHHRSFLIVQDHLQQPDDHALGICLRLRLRQVKRQLHGYQKGVEQTTEGIICL